jgi:hypothetical protein
MLHKIQSVVRRLARGRDKKVRRPGALRGQIVIHDDFDEIPPGFPFAKKPRVKS